MIERSLTTKGRRGAGHGLPIWATIGVTLICSLPAVAQESDVDQLTRALNEFSLDLYHQVADEPRDANIFFSPYSAFTALSMTATGARGETAEAMAKVLHFPPGSGGREGEIPWDVVALNRGMQELTYRFQNRGETIELNTANALWADQTFPFRDAFKSGLREFFRADNFSVNFKGDPEGQRRRINQWCAEQTKGKIEDLLPDGSVNSATRLILTNAIYFKAAWDTQFDTARTERQPFFVGDERSDEIDLMSASNQLLPYLELFPDGKVNLPALNAERSAYENAPNPDGFRILELPYRGKELGMVLLLPNRVTGLAEFEDALDAAQLSTWIKMLRAQMVDIYLPKFEETMRFDLDAALRQMGMGPAFEPGGFTGMSDSPQAGELYISQVAHKAFMKMDEEGTEAAAATSVTVGATSVEIAPSSQIFRADHPFLYLIRDRVTGAILFMGRFAKPVASGS